MTYKTSCSNCDKRIMNTDNLQVGCTLNRLEKFEAKGAKMIVDDDGCYKIDKVCSKGVDVKIDILVLSNEKTSSLDLKTTLYSLSIQNPLPYSVRVILWESLLDVVDLMKSLSEMELPFKYFVSVPARDLTLSEVIDGAVKDTYGQFYGLFDAGHEVRRDYLNRINFAYNDKLLEFLVINAYEDFNGTLINTYLHKKSGGNSTGDIATRITNVCKISKNNDLVVEFNELA